MTAFIFCLADSSYYKLPLFSIDEVFFSPDERFPNSINRFRCPVNSSYFTITNELGLSTHKSPSFVFLKTDASKRNLIKGLSKFRCPSFVSVADTHHFIRPIETIIQYLSSEDYSFISAENDRHHLKWYKRAGFNNLKWYPNIALTPNIVPYDDSKDRINRICFVGSHGRFHPFRKTVLKSLAKWTSYLSVLEMPQKEAAEAYSRYSISLNVSLNSDLNWRFFEVLAAGGFLLTDKLPVDSGINCLFQQGVHYEAFSSETELKSKIDYYLNHPKEARSIAKEGQSRYLEVVSTQKSRAKLTRSIFLGRQSPKHEYDDYVNCSSGLFFLRSYQTIQEICRIAPQTLLLYSDSLSSSSLIDDLDDFPRLNSYNILSVFGSNLISSLLMQDFYGYKPAFALLTTCKNSSNDLHYFKVLPRQPEFLIVTDIVDIAGYNTVKVLAESNYTYNEVFDCFIQT